MPFGQSPLAKASPHTIKNFLKIYFLTKIDINRHTANLLHQNKLALKQVKWCHVVILQMTG
jgi:hypothetical protein